MLRRQYGHWRSSIGLLGPEDPNDLRPFRRGEYEGSSLPSVQFVIAITDSPIDPPKPGPDLGILTMAPPQGYDPDEVHWGPARALELDSRQTRQFARFLRETVDLLAAIKPHRKIWGFIYTALEFILKAFSTQTPDLEQLLWHVVAIDAVLGDDGRGQTKRLERRISNILGTSEVERESWLERFDTLYRFRVHSFTGMTRLVRN